MHHSWLALAIASIILLTITMPMVDGIKTDNYTVIYFEIILDEVPETIPIKPNETIFIDLTGQVVCELYAQFRPLVVELSVNATDWPVVVDPSEISFQGTGVFEEPFVINISTPPLIEGVHFNNIVLSALVTQQPGGVSINPPDISAMVNVEVRNLTEDNVLEDGSIWGTSESSTLLPMSILVLAIFITIIIVIRSKGKWLKGLNKFRKS
jgi:hypothetical protein